MTDPITELLKTSRTIAVVGLSARRQRPSYGVAEYMQNAGYRIVPVNPTVSEVLGEKSFPHLNDLAGGVDIVNVFRQSQHIPEIAESAVRLGARALWLQEGVMHPAAEQFAKRAGLQVFSDLCILKEHVKRFRLK